MKPRFEKLKYLEKKNSNFKVDESKKQKKKFKKSMKARKNKNQA